MEILKGTIIAGPAGAAAGAVNWMLDVPFVTAAELLKIVKPGDLIEFNRGSFMHWAMYSDDKGMIINIPAEGKNVNKVTIKKERLLDVAGNSGVRVNNQEKVAAKLGYKKRSGRDALAAAKADLGKTFPYNFSGTNCEYYSTKWLYGHGFSTQINQATAGLVGTGFAAQVHGGYGAFLGTIIGGPVGGVIGYIVGAGLVGGAMSVIFDATGTTHYTRGDH